MITRLTGSQHFQKVPEFAYAPAYPPPHSSASQLSLSGFLNIALSAQHNVIRDTARSRPELFAIAMVEPDTVV